VSQAVFQPEQDGITDAEWQQLLDRASGEGRQYFSENQLYLAYARNNVVVTRYIARRGVMGLCMIVLGLAAWVYSLKADWGITLVLGIAVTLTGVGMVGTGVVTRKDPAPREPITRWLAKWMAVRGAQHLVTEASLGGAGLEYLPARVECVVLAERDELVDLLLKNGAHSALSALIVSEGGYPGVLASEARQLLEARADLPVIAVHDATPQGVAMLARLRKSSVFPLAQRAVLDAGLFPADITWLAELAPAIPAAHTSRVPLDSLSFDALLVGLRGVAHGALSLYTAIEAARSTDVANGPGDVGSGSEAAPARGSVSL
jgi:hypothetical protein